MNPAEEKSFPTILFQDYNSLWSELKNMYWSQTSKMLVMRLTKSCVEDIVTHFCPQCMTRYSDDEAHNHMNRCPVCLQCPSCSSVLSYIKAKNQWLCNYCSWKWNTDSSSEASRLSGLDVIKLEKEQEQNINNNFRILLQALQNKRDNNETTSKLSPLERSQKRQRDPWQLSDLESKLLSASKRSTENETIAPMSIPVQVQENPWSLDFNPSEKLQDTLFTSFSQRIQHPHTQPLSLNDLKPLRVQLRVKRTVRCRQDLDNNKMNILVQPKPLPLEGDSSQKSQLGKWWIKDSSAIHELPFPSILRLPSETDLKNGLFGFFDVSFTNPLESEVRLIFRATMEPKSPFIRVDTLGGVIEEKSFVQLQPSTQVSPSGSEDTALEVTLGAFEDELLRDEAESPKGELKNLSSGDSPGWSYETVHNSVIVRIPVKLAEEYSGDDVCIVAELHLHTVIKFESEDFAEIPMKIRICL